jgi:cytoskeleton protein RodZ
VRRERDPRLALIFAGGLLVVGAILLWNVAQRAITKDEPPPQVASAAASTQVQAHGSNNQVALGAPLPAPVESTTPEPYKTPGLDDAAANGGSVDAAHAAAKDPRGSRRPGRRRRSVHPVRPGRPVQAQGRGAGRVAGRDLGRHPASPQGRDPGGAWRRRLGLFRARPGGRRVVPRPAHARPDLDVSDPALFEVYAGGVLTGRLQSNQTALSKLVPAAPVAAKP